MRKSIKPPEVVSIEVTNRCNFRCIHCYASSGEKASGELTTDEIKSLISNLYEFGVETVVLTGGEPLVHPDIIELCEHVKACGLSLIINSNGALLTNEIAIKLSTLDLDLLSISLHGINSETHNEICGINSFNDSINAITIALRHKIPLGISSMICKLNYLEVPLIYKFAIAIGAKCISFFRFISVGRATSAYNQLYIGNDVHKDVIRSLIEIASNRDDVTFKIEAPFIDLDREECNYIETVTCKAGIEICTITSDGNVIGCNTLRDSSLYGGNVRALCFE